MTDPIQPIAQQLAAQLTDRAAVGVKKYSVSLDDAPLTTSQTIQHAIEEAFDLASCLERLRRDVAELERQRDALAADVAARDSRIEDLEAKVELARMLMDGKLRGAIAATQQKESSDDR